jgi:hypothetical protein
VDLLYAQYTWSVDTEQAGQCGKNHSNIIDACNFIKTSNSRAGCQQQHGHQQQLLSEQCNGRQQQYTVDASNSRDRELEPPTTPEFTKLFEGINTYSIINVKTSELF